MITSTGQWVGTADYMAPEQARGGEVDHRADLYAFGCVAFECITGSKPYAGDDAITLVFAHATRDIPSASAINPALGSRVDEVIRRALAKAPEDRYERATDLLAELREALEQAPVGGEPSAVPGRRPGSPRTRAAHGCPACRATASAGDASCGACGAALAWCASCAHPMLRSDRFCQHCGRPPR
jgi:serine/threonine-protein kinase